MCILTKPVLAAVVISMYFLYTSVLTLRLPWIQIFNGLARPHRAAFCQQHFHQDGAHVSEQVWPSIWFAGFGIQCWFSFQGFEEMPSFLK